MAGLVPTKVVVLVHYRAFVDEFEVELIIVKSIVGTEEPFDNDEYAVPLDVQGHQPLSNRICVNLQAKDHFMKRLRPYALEELHPVQSFQQDSVSCAVIGLVA
jgi:hypothetical protein